MSSLLMVREAVRHQASETGGAASPRERRHVGRSPDHPRGMPQSLRGSFVNGRR
jgi:hypothetical protein